MKKTLAVVLAMMMLLAVVTVFASCGGENDTKTESVSESTSESVTESVTEVPEKKVLKMATNAQFPPYEYCEDGVTIIGIDAEIAAAIAEKLGMELVIEDMEFNSIITAVMSGAVDMGMAGMTVSDERKEKVNFTVSYANGVQAIIVKEDSPITTADDLFAEGASYKIGVQLGTTGNLYAEEDFGEENVTPYANGNEAVLALQAGIIDCIIIDNEPAKAFVKANEGLKVLDTAYADEDYAICVAKENTELLEKIDAAILALTEDGTIEQIITKYIPAN